MMFKKTCWMTLIVALMMASVALAGNDAVPIMMPMDAKDARAGDTEVLPRDADGSRQGQVLLATDFFFTTAARGERQAAQRSFRGQRVGLTMFADKRFSLLLDDETRRGDILSVTGRIEGSELGTFSLTVGPETYVLHLQDMESGTLYRVVGDTGSGVGNVVTQDLNAPPPFTYSEPLVPPAGGEE
jgi:hypothetical protein